MPDCHLQLPLEIVAFAKWFYGTWRIFAPAPTPFSILFVRKREGIGIRPPRRRSGIGEHHARTWDSINTKCRLERSGLRWCGHSTESEQGTISIEWEGKRAKIGGVSCRTGGLHRRQKLTLRRQIQRRQATMTLTDQRTQ